MLSLTIQVRYFSPRPARDKSPLSSFTSAQGVEAVVPGVILGHVAFTGVLKRLFKSSDTSGVRYPIGLAQFHILDRLGSSSKVSSLVGEFPKLSIVSNSDVLKEVKGTVDACLWDRGCENPDATGTGNEYS